MEASFNDYVAYFKNLATKLKAIKHTDDEKHFYRMELDEVLTTIKSSELNFPAFALEAYDFNLSDSNSDNLLKNREGAFMILNHPTNKMDIDEIYTIWEACEEIADDIIIKMYADKRNPKENKVIRNIDLQSIQGKFLANQPGGLYGIRITFTIQSSKNNEVDTAKWLS